MIIERIKRKINTGKKIRGPKSAILKIKGWGKRRGENALIYYISNNNDPNKPYQKGITESEFEKAYKQLMTNGEFSKKWFKDNMHACANEGDCNFSMLGGIFKLLRIADYYEWGIYKKTNL